MPAVRSKSKSSRGVVITLMLSAHVLNTIPPMCLPVNVSNIEDLTEHARDLGISSNELRLDTSLSQIGTHSKVCDRSDHGDRSGDVVEETVRARLGERHASEDEGRDEHHGADGLH